MALVFMAVEVYLDFRFYSDPLPSPLRNENLYYSGADPGFFLGGGALVSCSISTPINHLVFFFAEYQLY